MARWMKQDEEAPARKADHWCAFVGCGKPGSMSHGLQGAGPWYCGTHFWSDGKRPDAGFKPAATLAASVAQARQRPVDDEDDWGQL